jgi:hypothetical protein
VRLGRPPKIMPEKVAITVPTLRPMNIRKKPSFEPALKKEGQWVEYNCSSKYTCKFINDRKLVCNLPTANRSSWCDEHKKVVFVLMPPRRNIIADRKNR